MELSNEFTATLVSHTNLPVQASSLPMLLVVDDDRAITEFMVDHFGHSYHVVTASSADDALVILSNDNRGVSHEGDGQLRCGESLAGPPFIFAL